MPVLSQATSLVTIKTPKYVIQEAQDERSYIRRHWLLFSLLCLAVVTFLIGRYSNIDMLKAFKGQKVTWDELNQELTAENEAQRKSISMLRTEAIIKDQAIAELQQTMVELNREKSALKAELVFYENLLSHKDDIKKLRVFDLSAVDQGDVIVLKVVLAQKLEKARMVEGVLKLQLNGISEDQGVAIDLVEQFKLDDAFAFKYFQVKKYAISLPNGFNPTTLLVELHSNNKKAKVVSEQFQWSDILANKATDLTQESSVNNQ